MTALLSTSFATPAFESHEKASGPYQLHSLARAISVLEVLGESDRPLSLTDICQRMSVHKSTAHRSLMVLERSRLIERTQENRFRLGLKLYELGNRAVEQIDLRARIHPFFRRLSMQVGETVHLSILQKASVVYLDKVEPHRKVRMSSKIGASNPVYCTAMGKAILAFQPKQTIEHIIGNMHFARYTRKTLCSREMLLKYLERVRRRGYAIDDEEIELGIRCIGAPIFNGDNQAIAAASVSGPSSRITAQSVPAIAEQLLRCCHDISVSLGMHAKKRSHLTPAPSRPLQQLSGHTT
jgi:DNA-binding IclR family transcriptional regulator